MKIRPNYSPPDGILLIQAHAHAAGTLDGTAIDPIFVDSSGGAVFEQSVRKALAQWRFEPVKSGAELPNNTVEIRFKDSRSRNSATRNFLRSHREIVRNLAREDIVGARKHLENARKFGGWNLYESTMLSLMIGRIEAAEGDDIEQLANYQPCAERQRQDLLERQREARCTQENF